MAKASPSPRARILARLNARGSCSLADLGARHGGLPMATRAALDALVDEGLVLERGRRIFEPRAACAARLEHLLRTTPRLFRTTTLRGRTPHPAFAAALEDLWAERRVLRFEVKGGAALGFLYLHRQHAGWSDKSDKSDVESVVLAAYARLGGEAVRIAELVAESGLEVGEVQAWIRRRVLGDGWGAVESGDWPSATPTERTAAVEHLGVPRLYVRIVPPPKA